MRKFIGIADNEAVKGIARHFRERIILFFLLFIVLQFVPCEDKEFHVAGKEIVQRRTDVIPKAGEKDAAFEIRAGMQNQATILHGNRLAV